MVRGTITVMGLKRAVTHPATLMLLLVSCRDCTGFNVAPPENIVILDPGHFGELKVTWSPPVSLTNMTGCNTMYQLEYFNSYKDTWTDIRTRLRSYSTQFDLMKDVRVRLYTLLYGPCTNGSMVKSASYAELVQKPSSEGVAGTRVRDFNCVFHNMENMECKWERSPNTPAKSKQTLYFWHEQLEQPEECKKYIISGGVRCGCRFTENELPRFTDINFCINGSSPKGPLQTTFTSLQTQNHVKPGTTEKPYLQTGPDAQLELHWESPVGSVPKQCLEWEVEHSHEGPDGKMKSQLIATKKRSLTLTLDNQGRHCFRVRSTLHMYCVDKSFWSEWSRPTCHPEMKEVGPKPDLSVLRDYVFIAVAIAATLVLALGLGAMLKQRTSRLKKKRDSLLTDLFVRNSSPALTET